MKIRTLACASLVALAVSPALGQETQNGKRQLICKEQVAKGSTSDPAGKQLQVFLRSETLIRKPSEKLEKKNGGFTYVGPRRDHPPLRRSTVTDELRLTLDCITSSTGKQSQQTVCTEPSLPKEKVSASQPFKLDTLLWFDSVSIFGKEAGEEAEDTDGLTFLGPDLSEELATIEFDHLGIITLEQEPVEANKENVARFTVELYCESMFFDVFNAD